MYHTASVLICRAWGCSEIFRFLSSKETESSSSWLRSICSPFRMQKQWLLAHLPHIHLAGNPIGLDILTTTRRAHKVDGNEGVSKNPIVTSHPKSSERKGWLCGNIYRISVKARWAALIASQFVTRRARAVHTKCVFGGPVRFFSAHRRLGGKVEHLKLEQWIGNVQVDAYVVRYVQLFSHDVMWMTHSALVQRLSYFAVETGTCITSLDTTYDNICDRREDKRWTCDTVGPSACWKRHINPLHPPSFSSAFPSSPSSHTFTLLCTSPSLCTGCFRAHKEMHKVAGADMSYFVGPMAYMSSSLGSPSTLWRKIKRDNSFWYVLS